MFRNSGSSAHVLPFLAHAIFLAAFLVAAVVAPASAQEKPKIRTITAFIRLDPGQYKQQFTDTLKMLRNAKARYGLAGYEVQTIRITTQPFPEYTQRHVETGGARALSRSRCPRQTRERLDQHWARFDG